MTANGCRRRCVAIAFASARRMSRYRPPTNTRSVLSANTATNVLPFRSKGSENFPRASLLPVPESSGVQAHEDSRAPRAVRRVPAWRTDCLLLGELSAVENERGAGIARAGGHKLGAGPADIHRIRSLTCDAGSVQTAGSVSFLRCAIFVESATRFGQRPWNISTY